MRENNHTFSNQPHDTPNLIPPHSQLHYGPETVGIDAYISSPLSVFSQHSLATELNVLLLSQAAGLQNFYPC